MRLPDMAKSLVTAGPVTGVRPVPGMGAPVFGEVNWISVKNLVTAWPVTGVRPVPGMGALVVDEITGVGEKPCHSLTSHRRGVCRLCVYALLPSERTASLRLSGKRPETVWPVIRCQGLFPVWVRSVVG